MGLGGVEAFQRGVGQFVEAVPDSDAAEPELTEHVGDLGGRGQIEQYVGGHAVTHAGAHVEQVIDGDPYGVAEPAQSRGARCGRTPGPHIDRRRPVEFAPPDALGRRQRERNLDQGRGRQLGVRGDPDLLPGVEVPDEQTAAQSALVQL